MMIFRHFLVASLSLVMSAPACAQWATRTRLLTSPNPSASGQQVQLTAEVDGLGGGAPTGSVSFADGAAMLGSGALSPYGAGQEVSALGHEHSCALTKGGRVNCWGWNFAGQLGDGTTTDRHAPVSASDLANVVAIATGWRHSCAVTSAGAVKCWGANQYGALGDGTTQDRHVPVAVSGLSSGVIAIAAGSDHTCALTSAGAVKCWGFNASGQLGDWTTTERHAPVAVAGLSGRVVAIAAGGNHTCALTNTGSVSCWGWNYSGQIGEGTQINHRRPVAVSGLSSGVVAIAGGDTHTCALTSAGAVRCWGSNGTGQIGDGTRITRRTSVPVTGLSSGVVAIVAGGGHTCALTSAGAVKCWGYNNWGQLGDGTIFSRLVPAAVGGLPRGTVVAIVAGGDHTCAMTVLGTVECWGRNDYGDLGDGTTEKRLTPIIVPGFKSLVRARAVLTTSSLSVGAHSLRASYLGNPLHSPSAGTRGQSVH